MAGQDRLEESGAGGINVWAVPSEFFRDHPSTADVTCGAQANGTNMLSPRLQAEGIVKGGHSIDVD
jgi:hypothetical protein